MKFWAGLNWRRTETSGEHADDISALIRVWGLTEPELLFITLSRRILESAVLILHILLSHTASASAIPSGNPRSSFFLYTNFYPLQADI
jgi:hypothetical protein